MSLIAQQYIKMAIKKERINKKINNESNDSLKPKNDRCPNNEINTSAFPNLNAISKVSTDTTIRRTKNRVTLRIFFFKMHYLMVL